MKTSGFLVTGVLLVAVIASDSLVGARRPSCLCGGLGAGTNPCRGEAGTSGGGIPVKAAKTPRPFLFASEAAINEAAAARAAAARAEAARAAAAAAATSSAGSVSYGCGHGLGIGGGSRADGASAGSAYEDDNGLTAQDLLSLDPHTPIAPRFKPIGDLCHTPSSQPTEGSGRTTTTVVPAYPGKPRCLACNNPIVLYGSSSSVSGSASSYSSGSSYASGSSSGHGLGYGLCGSCAQKGVAGSYSGSSSSSSRSGVSGISGISGVSGISGSGSGPAGCVSYNLPGFGSLFGGNRGPTGAAGGPFTATGGSGPFGSGVPNSLSSSNPSLNEFDNGEDEGLSFDEQERIYNGQTLPQIPADAVSVTLAYKNLVTPRVNAQKMAKRIIPEERLSFGPRTIPADGRVQKTPTTDVPEERLQIVDKPIVELKSLSSGTGAGSNVAAGGTSGCQGPTDEDLAISEALERERMELEAEAAQAGPGTSGAYITYSDLGYGPVAPSGNQFINSPAEYATACNEPSVEPRTTFENNDDGSPCGPLGPPLPGYRPGGVIVRHEAAPKSSQAQGHDLEDGSEEDGYDAAGSYEEDDSSTESGLRGGCSRSTSGSSRSSTGLSRLWKQASHHRAGSSDCLH